jgi:hypothetical protein
MSKSGRALVWRADQPLLFANLRSTVSTVCFRPRLQDGLIVGLTGERVSPDCPVWGEAFHGGVNVAIHNLRHVVPASDGNAGFMWQCGCGSQDCVWEDKFGAGAGLSQQMTQSHRIRAM